MCKQSHCFSQFPPTPPTKSKYIENLMKAVGERNKEQDRRTERKIQKEREAEGEKYVDKDAFVTSAYKKKLQERAEEKEQERRAADMEGELLCLRGSVCLSARVSLRMFLYAGVCVRECMYMCVISVSSLVKWVIFGEHTAVRLHSFASHEKLHSNCGCRFCLNVHCSKGNTFIFFPELSHGRS